MNQILKKVTEIKFYFPENKQKFFQYLKIFLPALFANLFFNLNGFIDNFMVNAIDGAPTALGYANSWTQIINSIIVGISLIGIPLFAQYYGKKDYFNAKQILKVRTTLVFLATFPFALLGWILPKNFIYLIRSNISVNNLKLATEYLQVIIFSWILFVFSYSYSTFLRESGHVKFSFFLEFFILAANCILNFLFIQTLNMGVKGAAIATVISRVLSILISIFYAQKHAKITLINPFSFFIFQRKFCFLFLKKIPAFILTTSAILFVSLRPIFWNFAYPENSIGLSIWQLGAGSIITFSGSISDIFLSTIPCISVLVSFFVGRKLGQNDFSRAKKNSKEIQGFLFFISIFMSFFLLIICLLMPYFNFLISGSYDNFYIRVLVEEFLQKKDVQLIVESLKNNSNYEIENLEKLVLDFQENVTNFVPEKINFLNNKMRTLANNIDLQKINNLASENLRNLATQKANIFSKFYLSLIQKSLIPIIIFNPIWVVMIAASQFINIGGKTLLYSNLQFFTGIFQILWLIAIWKIVVFHNSNIPFYWAFFTFYVSDLIKFVIFEIFYFKTNWLINITKKQ